MLHKGYLRIHVTNPNHSDRMKQEWIDPTRWLLQCQLYCNCKSHRKERQGDASWRLVVNRCGMKLQGHQWDRSFRNGSSRHFPGRKTNYDKGDLRQKLRQEMHERDIWPPRGFPGEPIGSSLVLERGLGNRLGIHLRGN